MSSPRLPRHVPICPMSPLKSPAYNHHFDAIDYNTHWPELRSEDHPVYRKMLICKDGAFRAAVDVHDFEKEEINVKVVGHTIHVEAEHEEKEDDHSLISRKLNRTYVLPPAYNMDLVESSIEPRSGILRIKVPPPKSESQERIIPITIEDSSQQSQSSEM